MIATGYDFPDALTGTPFSAKYNMPILFAVGDNLDSQTADAMDKWDIKKTHISGGTCVVSESIADEISGLGIEVDRISGIDRYETAIR